MVKILPIPDPKSKGWRLRVELYDGSAVLSCERTHPERVADPDAQFIEPTDCIWLDRPETVWLSDALTELLKCWP